MAEEGGAADRDGRPLPEEERRPREGGRDGVGRPAVRAGAVEIGRVVGAHGVRGEVRFAPYNRATEAIRPGLRVTLSLGAEPDRRLELSAARPHKNGFLLGLAGVDSMSEAERLVGARVLVDRADLPAAGEGEFYWLDLIGLQAVTEDGTPIGRVAGIFETPGHDVLVLRDGDRERLVPAVDEVVREVDVAGGRLVIRPVEGLLEL